MGMLDRLEDVAGEVGAATGSLTARKQLASKAVAEKAKAVAEKAKAEAGKASDGLKGPMGKVNARVATLLAQVATLQEENAALVAAADQKAPTLRAALKHLQAQHRQLQERTLAVQAEHSKLEDAHQLLQTAHDTKDCLVRDLKTEVGDFHLLVGNLRSDVGRLEAQNKKLWSKQDSLRSLHEQYEDVKKKLDKATARSTDLERMLTERQAEVDNLRDTIEHDTSFLKMKASELSLLRTKWEDFANADEAWLDKVPLEHLRWLEQDARKRVARIETEVELRKLKLAAEAIEDTPAAENMKCVITQAVMQDPVFISDGHTFERTAIAEWFQEGKLVSPQTNLPVDGTVTSNHALRNIIQNALQAQLKAWKQQDPPHDPIPPNTAGDSVFNPVMHDKGFTLAKPGSPYVGQKRLHSERSVSPRPWRRSRREGRMSASPPLEIPQAMGASPEPSASSSPTHSPPHSPRAGAAGGAGRLNRWSPGLGDLTSPNRAASPASPARVVLED